MNNMSTKEMLQFASVDYPHAIKEQWLQGHEHHINKRAEKLNITYSECTHFLWFEHCDANQLPECYLDI